jgi:hypothetical protein
MADTSRPAPARNHDRAAALADAIVWVFRDTFTAWFRGDTVDVREARAAIEAAIRDALHEAEQDIRSEIRLQDE